jgi:RNA-directed DNA polymerase
MSPAPTPRYEWEAIRWRDAERRVFKLQKRIYQAQCRGETKAVHRLQRLLVTSWSAKCLAVRRVTQDNRGKRTAGVDGVTALTPPQRLRLARTLRLAPKARPTRRVWIPKPGTTDRRPLGIPTLSDRAAQALLKLALEPEWEAKFEPNSYGFRPGRSGHDAIEAILIGVCHKAKFVLDADIAKCFDRINHDALLRKLATTPTFRRVVRAWLKAGVMDGRELFPTEEGTPQGGVLSPLLANVALHGLETAIVSAVPRWNPANGKEGWVPIVVRYADDVRHITGRSIPVADGGGSEGTTSGPTADLAAKANGDKSMPSKRERPEGAYGRDSRGPRDTVKARLPEPQSPAMQAYVPR